MSTFYLICFVLGLVLSVLALFSGLGRVHLGHLHLGSGHMGGHVHAKAGGSVSALNGFTLTAFLCWFGGVGYLLEHITGMLTPWVLLAAVFAGLLGAGLLYGVLFKLLLPRERVLDPEDTRMEGMVAQVSDAIRAEGGVGEILYTQLGVRRSAAARSEDGSAMTRGTEVVVLRYERGIATVRPLGELEALGSGESGRERKEFLSG